MSFSAAASGDDWYHIANIKMAEADISSTIITIAEKILGDGQRVPRVTNTITNATSKRLARQFCIRLLVNAQAKLTDKEIKIVVQPMSQARINLQAQLIGVKILLNDEAIKLQRIEAGEDLILAMLHKHSNQRK